MAEVSLENKTKIPLTGIQRLIAKRMLASKRNKPCFYVRLQADVTELMAMRHKLKKALGVKITSNSFHLHALALAAEKYPVMLAKLDGDSFKIPDEVNIGFAVNAPQGLVVPVLKKANEKSLAEIATEEKILIDKARNNTLTLEEMEGETIALSNLGPYGIEAFVGIVPPQTSTILSVGNIIRHIVPENNKPVVKKLVGLSLAVDYRITTGTYAAEFLNFIKEELQNPQKLL